VRLQHVLGDADGFFQLTHDLAELCRMLRAAGDVQGAPLKLHSPPVLRSFMSDLQLSDEERREALEFKPTIFALNPEAPEAAPTPPADAVAATSPPPPPPPVVGRVLRFSGQELAALKVEANASAPAGSEPLTSFDALSAHLWQSVLRARLRHAEAQGLSAAAALASLGTEFLTPANWRGPSRLDLPARYFPNGILTLTFAARAEQLTCGAALGETAAVVHAGMRQLSKEDALRTLCWIAAQPDKSRVRVAFDFARGGFLVTQWTRFDMYAGMALGDTGAGQPALSSMPFTPASLFDGLVYFLPTGAVAPSGADQEPGQDVHMALSEPVWRILDEDERFRRPRGVTTALKR